ncbi:MAG: DUF4136 domain-containing protein [Gloeobacteraceae cyanobacterium ES-bin-316]|nr:DUF4136 domain-containing protein [Ferruginibacter sp.]
MKKTTWIFAGLAALFSFTLISCASTAHIEKDDSVNFGNYKTFAWVEQTEKDSVRPNDLVEQKVKQVVQQELEKNAGWKQVTSKPDVLLSYDVLVERSVREKNDPVYSRGFTRTFYNPRARRYFNVYYPSQFMGYDNYDVPVQEGTVTVSMIDSKTDKTVWQGWTTEEIDSRKIKTKEVESAIKTIFKKFDLARN